MVDAWLKLQLIASMGQVATSFHTVHGNGHFVRVAYPWIEDFKQTKFDCKHALHVRAMSAEMQQLHCVVPKGLGEQMGHTASGKESIPIPRPVKQIS